MLMLLFLLGFVLFVRLSFITLSGYSKTVAIVLVIDGDDEGGDDDDIEKDDDGDIEDDDDDDSNDDDDDIDDSWSALFVLLPHDYIIDCAVIDLSFS